MAKHHPDAGGDDATAALITEAWRVLGDSDSRAAYDARRAAKRDMERARAGAPASGAPTAGAWSDRTRCPFCAAPVAKGGALCPRCRAPLATVAAEPPRGAAAGTGAERRRLPRVSRADWAFLRLDHRTKAIDVRMRDLSLTGVSFHAGVPVESPRRVRVTGAAFDAVVDVVSCRRQGSVWVVHGTFVTAAFRQAQGGFVQAQA
jgi:curved DNA-binding protein CbpA